MTECWKEELPAGAIVEHEVTMDQDAVDRVRSVVDYVLEQVRITGGQLFTERRVPIGHVTGEEGAGGTSDIVLLVPEQRLVRVIDFKMGRGKVDAFDVEIPAGTDPITGVFTPAKLSPNLQLLLYAAGVIEEMRLYDKVDTITLTILQPAINHVSEFTLSMKDALDKLAWLRKKADETRTHPKHEPSFDNCFFCKAKDDCKARKRLSLETALDGFEDVETAVPKTYGERPLPSVGVAYELVPLIRDWCDGIERQLQRKLDLGETVLNSKGIAYKLVEGKKGNRDWVDEGTAALTLDMVGVPEDAVFKKKLITPAQAEELAKEKRNRKKEVVKPALIKPELWELVEAHIAPRKAGAPQIALETDPRPALRAAADFDENPAAAVPADCADLF